MKFGKTLLAGVVAATLAATSAEAADLTVPVITAPPPPAEPAFSWAGPYVSAIGSFLTCDICIANAGELGVRAGYDFAFGNFVIGANATLYAYYDTVSGLDGGVEGLARAGFVLGERAMVYAQGGLGHFFSGANYYTIGGGVAFAVGDSASIFAEVMPYRFLPVSATTLWKFSAGFTWHFGG